MLSNKFKNTSFLCFLLIITANLWGYEFHRERKFGPSMHSQVKLTSPFTLKTWIPHAGLSYNFDWYEPMQRSLLGEELAPHSKYLRFKLNATITPWMANFNTGLGVGIIPRFEFFLQYSTSGYLKSNVIFPVNIFVESTTEHWQANYVYKHLYDYSSWAYEQRVAINFIADLSFGYHKVFLQHSYSLIETSSVKENYTYDYFMNMPIQGKDFLSSLTLSYQAPIYEKFWWTSYLNWMQTGEILDFVKDSKAYKFRQWLFFLGPKYQFEQHDISLQIGGFLRPKKQFKDQNKALSSLLLQCNWTYYWPLIKLN